MIFGTGIDIVDIKKIKKTVEKWGKSFNDKIFTPQELNYCYQKKSPFQHLAARFAAKEAFLKALDPTPTLPSKWGGRKGGGHLRWKEIEIGNYQGGQPFYRLKGSVNSWVNREKIKPFLTISHTGNYAIAHCLLEK